MNAIPLALLLFAQTEAQDQIELLEPKARQGFFLSIGMGGLYMGMNAKPVGNLGFFQGGRFNLRFGQMVNDLLGLGFQIELGGGQTSEWSGGYGGLRAEFQVAPFDVVDLAFHGSIGVAGIGIGRKDEEQARDDDPSGSYGSYYALGVSYDWFPFYDKGDSGGFAITSFIEARIMPLGDILAGGGFIGVEISYYFGFGKNRLDLDVDKAFKK